MSLTLEEIEQSLIQAGLDLASRQKALKELKEAEAAKKEEREGNKAAKSKYNYTVIVRSDNADIKAALENTECFISKTDEAIDQNTIVDRMKVAALEQNRNCKKKGKIFTLGDYFAAVKSKFHKIPEAGVKNVSKQPVRIIVVENENLVEQ
jgi:hypothetical protein